MCADYYSDPRRGVDPLTDANTPSLPLMQTPCRGVDTLTDDKCTVSQLH